MLSVPHLIIIFLVALVVFGPQKLPELARNLGKLMAEFRRATGDLRSTFDEQMRELERESQLIEQRKRDLEAREAAVQAFHFTMRPLAFLKASTPGAEQPNTP